MAAKGVRLEGWAELWVKDGDLCFSRGVCLEPSFLSKWEGGVSGKARVKFSVRIIDPRRTRGASPCFLSPLWGQHPPNRVDEVWGLEYANLGMCICILVECPQKNVRPVCHSLFSVFRFPRWPWTCRLVLTACPRFIVKRPDNSSTNECPARQRFQTSFFTVCDFTSVPVTRPSLFSFLEKYVG